MFDIIIRNGDILDGTGNPSTKLDIAVKDGKIALIDNLRDLEAKVEIDARNKVVSPGFIDTHTHSDLLCTKPDIHKIRVQQGVTTELFGQDGISVAPVSAETKPLWRNQLKGLDGDIGDWPWNSIDEYLTYLEKTSIAGNALYLVPHGGVRTLVMGFEERTATKKELDQMTQLVAEGMQQGAVGVSSGLIYPPNVYSNKEELIAICSGAARYDGVFVVHIRNESSYIKSLVMMSSDDMTNWTYHGIIKTDSIAPWIQTSWAPSIAKREEADGKTHFYLYFSNSGGGTAVLTSTSPIGPWSSPLNHSLVDTNTPGIAGECKAAFDPGVVIDDKGKGWLTVGGGCARIMRLGKDMISVDGPIKPIRAPHHFEANELNYINGTYVYTYNIDWQDFSDWPLPTEKPTTCCMSYMTSKTPLVTKSWKYQHNYMKNPGDYGFDYSNNHTHLHKFRGKWYVFYHTMSLQHSFNTTAGFRNVCVDEIQVDENTVNIHMGNQTLKGVKQIQPMNPFIIQQAETTAATQGVKFTNGKSIGDMYAVTVPNKTGIIAVRGVEFNKVPSSLEIKASGNGIIEVRRDRPDGEVIASIKVGTPQMKLIESQLQKNMTGTMDLCFVLKGNNITFDEWKFK